MSDAPEQEERSTPPSLLDVLVFAPIDAAFVVLGDPRGAAARGRARVEEALRQARTLGELSVRFGSRELRRRTEGGEPSGSGTAAAAQKSAPRRDAGPPPNDVIADYDTLSASQIVPLLPSLDAAERGRVAAYEAKARGRQTILRRLEQLDQPGG